MATFEVTIDRQGLVATAHATVTHDGHVSEFEFTIDASDGGAVAQGCANRGNRGALQLATLRSQLSGRAEIKARNRAREQLWRSLCTAEELNEFDTRLPLSPISAGLQAKILIRNQLLAEDLADRASPGNSPARVVR